MAEAVLRFAAAYGASWVEALVAAGYLTRDQAAETGYRPLSDIPTPELMQELSRRADQAA